MYYLVDEDQFFRKMKGEMMTITWFGMKEREGIASFYANNITLNMVASYPLMEAYKVQVGKDEKDQLVIKPISKEKAESGIYDEYALLPYEVRKSFSRINSASLMRQIERSFGISLSNSPKKFMTRWDEKENILFIDMSKEI